MAFGDKKADSRDTVTVEEQVKIVKATSDERVLARIAQADRRPGVVEALQARRDQLGAVKRAADAAVAAAVARQSPVEVPGKPEGLEAQGLAMIAARDNPPSGKSGKSCAKCPHHQQIGGTYSTVNCEKIKLGSLTTVGTATAEDCEHYE